MSERADDVMVVKAPKSELAVLLRVGWNIMSICSQLRQMGDLSS